jgi:hypothetical protein
MTSNTDQQNPKGHEGLFPSLPELSDSAGEMDSDIRTNMSHLDAAFHSHWTLGKNIILAWCIEDSGLIVLVVPHYTIGSIVVENRSTSDFSMDEVSGMNQSSNTLDEYIRSVVKGERLTSSEKLHWAARLLEVDPVYIKLPTPLRGCKTEINLIDKLISRYSISLIENRAVVLFDITGFSLLEPFQQVTQLNSLAYSVNAAHSKFLNNKIEVDFARSSTGDGFYIWNKNGSAKGNADLYNLMHFVLADNAIAQSKSKGHNIPRIKAGFHIGSYYEFHQSERLHPTRYNYIVGEATIELARIVEMAVPGQILVGDFQVKMTEADSSNPHPANVNSVGFIEQLQCDLETFNGLELSGEKIKAIGCYLTGKPIGHGKYSVSKFRIRDKHGLSREVFNAKMNIRREKGDPIFLGIQEKDVTALQKIANEVVPGEILANNQLRITPQ